MISEEKKQVLDLFAEGRNHYKMMMFPEALKCFSRALKIDPNDGPSQVYYARCKLYTENPPPEDWDGVFVMTSK
ncbi:tetratricopeptide repeat protein [Spirochaeta dissipatitropha]